MSDATQFVEGVARFCGRLGISPTMGRLWAVLWLAPDPMSLDELVDAVDAAKSTVSVAMRRLESVGLVRRNLVKGDRRDWYEPVTDLEGVFPTFRQALFEPQLGQLSASAAKTASSGAGPVAERMARLERFLKNFSAGSVVH